MATKESLLSPELVRQLIHYDPATGEFTWKVRDEVTGADRTFNKRFSGRKALINVGANGYRVGAIKCVCVYAHRVAWAWVNGVWPVGEIDHVDGDRTNNAFSNLRQVTRSENAKNLGHRKNKPSGLPKGVFKNPKQGPSPFKAQIVVRKKAIFLGLFRDADSASEAYRAAAKKYGYSGRHAEAGSSP